MKIRVTQVVGGWHASDEQAGLTYFGLTEEEATQRLKTGVKILRENRRANATSRENEEETKLGRAG